MPALLSLAKNFKTSPTLSAAALSAARNLVTTEEAVLGEAHLELHFLGRSAVQN